MLIALPLKLNGWCLLCWYHHLTHNPILNSVQLATTPKFSFLCSILLIIATTFASTTWVFWVIHQLGCYEFIYQLWATKHERETQQLLCLQQKEVVPFACKKEGVVQKIKKCYHFLQNYDMKLWKQDLWPNCSSQV